MASYEPPTEPVYADDRSLLVHVHERLHTLTRALALVAVLTVAALGIALWALLSADDDEGRARAATVRALEERVDELEAEVERTPERVQVSIREEQQALDERVDSVEQETSQAIEGLRADVEELQQRVRELEQTQERPTTPEQ